MNKWRKQKSLMHERVNIKKNEMMNGNEIINKEKRKISHQLLNYYFSSNLEVQKIYDE